MWQSHSLVRGSQHSPPPSVETETPRLVSTTGCDVCREDVYLIQKYIIKKGPTLTVYRDTTLFTGPHKFGFCLDWSTMITRAPSALPRPTKFTGVLSCVPCVLPCLVFQSPNCVSWTLLVYYSPKVFWRRLWEVYGCVPVWESCVGVPPCLTKTCFLHTLVLRLHVLE